MSGGDTQTRGVSTVTLSILVALGVIALLAGAEYAIPRWLHSGPGDSGSFISSNSFPSNSPVPGPSAPASRPALSIKPGPGPDPATGRGNGGAANPKFPSLKSLPCPTGDAQCWDRKKRTATHKSPADAGVGSQASPPSDPEVSSAPQDATQPSKSGENTRATEENLRATEDANAHLVALEREERDRLADRARAMSERVEAAQKQQPAPGQRLEDLAFSQQRLQNDLNQADAALKTADVQKAKIYLDLAKGELEKIAKLLGRQ
jgi:hypothetical protein